LLKSILELSYFIDDLIDVVFVFVKSGVTVRFESFSGAGKGRDATGNALVTLYTTYLSDFLLTLDLGLLQRMHSLF
jgi:hypothetical protein